MTRDAELELLAAGATEMGFALDAQRSERLLRLVDELESANTQFNLTAIRDRPGMLRKHVFDSLSLQPYLRGARLADVGTGAGFPGLPLAVVNPERRFTLIDSNGKKIRFVQHAARELGLENVEGVHGRVEASRARPFDTVVARAFAALPELVVNVAPLCGPQTRVLAMKGKWPQDEIDALPAGWRHQESRELTVPGLDESRCVIVLSRQGP